MKTSAKFGLDVSKAEAWRTPLWQLYPRLKEGDVAGGQSSKETAVLSSATKVMVTPVDMKTVEWSVQQIAVVNPVKDAQRTSEGTPGRQPRVESTQACQNSARTRYTRSSGPSGAATYRRRSSDFSRASIQVQHFSEAWSSD